MKLMGPIKLPKELVYGRDYDGWALPSRDAKAPHYSHFTSSAGQPSLPKGCVPVKICQVHFVVVKQKESSDKAEDYSDAD